MDHFDKAARSAAKLNPVGFFHCILPWIPLMRGRTELSIIKQWQELAAKEADRGVRSAYVNLAFVFAELMGSLPDWKKALEGWDMRVSQVVLEWETEGALRQAREDLLDVLKARVPQDLPTDLKTAIENISDKSELSRLLKVAATSASLDAFRAAM
jgi:hypothetical protein